MRNFPQKSESLTCGNEALVRDLRWQLQLNTCEIMLELAFPLPIRSDHDPTLTERVPRPPRGKASPSIFRGTFCLARHSILCTRQFRQMHFVRDFPQKVRGRCENEPLVGDFPRKVKRWRCENEPLVGDFPLLGHPIALMSLCCDIPLLWNPCALTPLCFDIRLFWHPFALMSLCFDIPLLWHPCAVTFQRSVTRNFDFQTSFDKSYLI